MMVRSDQGGALRVHILDYKGFGRLEAGAARGHYIDTDRPGRHHSHRRYSSRYCNPGELLNLPRGDMMVRSDQGGARVPVCRCFAVR